MCFTLYSGNCGAQDSLPMIDNETFQWTLMHLHLHLHHECLEEAQDKFMQGDSGSLQ